MSEQATYTEAIYQEYNGKHIEPLHRREEIVRCGDCKWVFVPDWDDTLAATYRAPPFYCASRQWSTVSLVPMQEVKLDGFCAWGEPRED